MKDTQLYEELLGLTAPWNVVKVQLNMEKEEVEVFVEYKASRGVCPKCQKECAIYDRRKERRWRHLDTCQLKTFLVCSVPRISCPEHGISTLETPWARSNSRFTLLFEKLAIDFLLAFRKQTKVAKMLRISFDQMHLIMCRAVGRGLSRRDSEKSIEYIGLDEKGFQKRHCYASILIDLANGCVIEVAENRDKEAAVSLLKNALSARQRNNIKAVSMDMWKPYMKAVKECLPQADIVHDHFHLSRYLNSAVDNTRRRELKTLEEKEKTILKKSRALFLCNPDRWTDAYKLRFEQIQEMNLKTSNAWRVKENFKGLFQCTDISEAKIFFQKWYRDAVNTGIHDIKRVARIFLKHIDGILNYVLHRITNALVESINSIIQEIKYAARGYRSFRNFRIAILFFLGKLDLFPQEIQ